MPGKRAGHRSGRGRGDRAQAQSVDDERAARSRRATGRCEPLRRQRVSTPAARGATRPSIDARRAARPATRIDGPAMVARDERDDGDRAGLARDAHARTITWCSSACEAPRARACDRHAGRSGAARSVQQPVHGDRRADGRDAANTAYSVNIKERLDFSCALFDADGNLIANAPHMPVHLGSMGESVRRSSTRRADTMRPATCSCSTRRTTAARTCPT